MNIINDKEDKMKNELKLISFISKPFLSKKSKERVRVLLKFLNHLITADIPASNIGEKEIIEAFKL